MSEDRQLVSALLICDLEPNKDMVIRLIGKDVDGETVSILYEDNSAEITVYGNPHSHKEAITIDPSTMEEIINSLDGIHVKEVKYIEAAKLTPPPKKEIPKQVSLEKRHESCPNCHCSGTLIYVEGCIRCLNCGWSACTVS